MSVAKQLFNDGDKETTSLHLAIPEERLSVDAACRIISALASKIEFLVALYKNKQNNNDIKFQFIITKFYVFSTFATTIIMNTVSLNSYFIILCLSNFALIILIEYIRFIQGKNESNIIKDWADDKIISESEETLNHGHFLIERTPLTEWQKIELSLHLERAEQALMEFRKFKKKS